MNWFSPEDQSWFSMLVVLVIIMFLKASGSNMEDNDFNSNKGTLSLAC